MSAVGAVLALAISSQAAHAAEHSGPEGLFLNQTPAQATAAIAKVCSDRGFAVRSMGDNDVVCQGGDMWRSVKEFRADPPAHPGDKPQIYHRFVAVAGDDGTHVKERSVIVWSIGGNLTEVTPRFVMAKVINERILELYRTAGAVVSEK